MSFVVVLHAHDAWNGRQVVNFFRVGYLLIVIPLRRQYSIARHLILPLNAFRGSRSSTLGCRDRLYDTVSVGSPIPQSRTAFDPVANNTGSL